VRPLVLSPKTEKALPCHWWWWTRRTAAEVNHNRQVCKVFILLGIWQ